ncbi:hypothetical protein, variant [Aphanomyces astaci]|nr:hypothetical protein, variant [Aphanomyces astaci]ETV84585.1 hypothetical protein, variant [Aphanomyces astaci]|eukprot:XP_009826277.1 hypothetical protein, variant [Aphanomyces astaci]
MLGVTIRFDSFDGVEDHLLHVLEVAKKSPADVATLEPGADYLLGTPERVFRDPEDLYDEIVEHLDQPFQCYVYNAKTDQVRLVRITPHDRWGGEGYLGAEIGHGYLHRLPASVHATIGESVGFVSISSQAKAATDYFATSAPAADRPAVEEVQPTQEDTSAPILEEEHNDVAPLAVDEPTEVAPSEDPEAGLPASVLASASINNVEESASPSVGPPTPPKGPTYPPPVGTGIGFPMSTVATYIDPMSPKAAHE